MSIPRLSERAQRRLVALFFTLILALGLLTSGDYDSAWDDLGEMNILRMALKEYAAILPFDTSVGRALLSSELPRLSESIERDHGVCMYYPLFWAFARGVADVRAATRLWRAWTWLIFTFGLYALYALCRRVRFSRALSCLAALLVLLSPRFFAEGHYNSKDIVLMALALSTLWQAARLMEKPCLNRAACFMLIGGACAATRVIGVAVCAACGLMVAAYLILNRRFTRRALGLGLLTLAGTACVYLLLTPAALPDPLGFAAYVAKNAVGFTRWSGKLLFLGTVIDCSYTVPPRSYLPVMIFVTTPLWATALREAGGALRRTRLRRRNSPAAGDERRTRLVASALLWLLPLAGCVALRVMVYNSWRHVYFVYGFMAVCMAYGLGRLWRAARSRRVRRAALCAAVSASLCVSAVGVACNHPFQYGYFNPLVPKENRALLFDMDYWNLSCASALRALLAQTEGTVRIAAADRSSFSGLALASDFVEDRLEVLRGADAMTQADYVLSNLSYTAMDGASPGEGWTPVVTISAYGCPMTVVYALPKENAE